MLPAALRGYCSRSAALVAGSGATGRSGGAAASVASLRGLRPPAPQPHCRALSHGRAVYAPAVAQQRSRHVAAHHPSRRPLAPATLASHTAMADADASAATAASALAPPPTPTPAAFVTPEKSASDDRSYRVLTLPDNGLQVVLVSDAEADRASASMDVHVGHHCDPDDTPGLAHFCEHMLFLGTTEYPDETSYKRWLSEHGGSSNASTSADHTRYYCTVRHEYLPEALRRFGSFFTSPLFTESATDRELHAVENEFRRNEQTDGRRRYQLLKAAARPEHPFHKFGTGNLLTLRDRPSEAGIDVRQRLMRFHGDHYSADIMRLCVLGREPLDELQAMVLPLFAGVRNLGKGPPGPSAALAHPFGPAQVGKVVSSVPVRDRRFVHLTWPIPTQPMRDYDKPTGWLSHVIGYEGAGSLLSLLKRRGHALSLSAGPTKMASFATFGVTVELTPEGAASYTEVVAAVYQYAELLRRAVAVAVAAPGEADAGAAAGAAAAAASEADASAPARIYAEMRQVRDTGFRFRTKPSPAHTTTTLCRHLQYYPGADIFTGPALLRHFRPRDIAAALECMVPSQCLVRFEAPEVEGTTDATEPWYGTPHRVDGIASLGAEVLASWNVHATPGAVLDPSLTLPAPNTMIATDFSIRAPQAAAGEDAAAVPAPVPAPGITPQLLASVISSDGDGDGDSSSIADSDRLTLWFHQDGRFRLPRASVQVVLHMPAAAASPRAEALSELLASVLDEVSNEFAYDAAFAGMHMGFNDCTEGFALVVAGYNHKLGNVAAIAAPAVLRGAAAFDAAAPTSATSDASTGVADAGGVADASSAQSSPSAAAAACMFSFPDAVFARLKAKLQRSIANRRKAQPHEHTSDRVAMVLVPDSWDDDARLAALETLTADDLRAHHAGLFNPHPAGVDGSGSGDDSGGGAGGAGGRLSLEAFAYGNLDAGEARGIAHTIAAALGVASPAETGTSVAEARSDAAGKTSGPGQLAPVARADRRRRRCARLPARSYLVSEVHPLNPDDTNSAITMLLQLCPYEHPHYAYVEVLRRLIKAPFFAQLRTREQLGYLVWSTTPAYAGVSHLNLRVQSSSASGHHLLERVEAFLANFAVTLRAMPPDEFASHVAVLRKNVLESDKRPTAESQRAWGEVTGESYLWEWARYSAEALAGVTQAAFCDWYDAHIRRDGPERRVVVATLTATQSAKPGTTAAGAGAGAGAEAAVAGAVPVVGAVSASGVPVVSGLATATPHAPPPMVAQGDALAALARGDPDALAGPVAVTDAAAFNAALTELWPRPANALRAPGSLLSTERVLRDARLEAEAITAGGGAVAGARAASRL